MKIIPSTAVGIVLKVLRIRKLRNGPLNFKVLFGESNLFQTSLKPIPRIAGSIRNGFQLCIEVIEIKVATRYCYRAKGSKLNPVNQIEIILLELGCQATFERKLRVTTDYRIFLISLKSLFFTSGCFYAEAVGHERLDHILISRIVPKFLDLDAIQHWSFRILVVIYSQGSAYSCGS
jgi:hypothetical protein